MAKAHRQCTHLNTLRAVTPSGDGCQECLAMGVVGALVGTYVPGKQPRKPEQEDPDDASASDD